jgi:hypothetical protein
MPLIGILTIAAALLLPSTISAQEANEEPSGAQVQKAGPPVTVHGIVRNSATGEALAHALVSTDAAGIELGALTDVQGRFEIANLPAGMAEFTVRKPGYRDPVPGGGKESVRSARLAPSMPDIILSLRPAATLEGQVQLSTGDPASNSIVDLLRRSVTHGRVQWETVNRYLTDDQGIYLFTGLEPGIYTLHSEPRLENAPTASVVDPAAARLIHRNGYPCAYYPDARNLSGAAQIHIGPGENAHADITLSLQPFYPVTFTVQSPNGQSFVPDAGASAARRKDPLSVEILDVENHHTGDLGRYDQETGTVQADLPDGVYTLRIFVNAETAGKAAMGDAHSGYLMGLGPFTVAGHALRNVPIALFAPTSHLLHVRRPANEVNSAGQPSPSVDSAVARVWLSPAADPLLNEKNEMNATREGDEYELMFNPPSPQWLHTKVGYGFCAGALAANGVNPAREPLVSNPAGSNPPLELQLRNDCAQLTLTFPAAANTESPGIVPRYSVYVVPEFETTEDAAEAMISAQQSGMTELKWLTPGHYRIYTFEEPVELPYRDPAAMAQLQLSGQAITLVPGEHAQIVLELPSNP